MDMYRFIKWIQTMLDQTASKRTELIRSAAHPLAGTPHDYDALLDLIGEARFVLIGEASHGTHEFYRERYGCLEYFGADPQLYGYATSLGKAETCEDEVVGQLVELQHR
jgi:erythromycin esterase-like protein